MTTETAYGSWTSPIAVRMVADSGIGLSEVVAEGDAVYWHETRPADGGRGVVVRAAGGKPEDLTQPGFDVRTRVHEYGGGAFLVHGGRVFFSNDADQRLYRLPPDGSSPTPITPEPDSSRALRYADGVMTPDGASIVCVRERHAGGEPRNEIVVIPADGTDEPAVIAGRHDFVAAPRLSPDGRHLAWLTWDHPNMPWDGTDLWVAEFDGRSLGRPRHVAGGPSEAVQQPVWSRAGRLHYVSDRSGWWNLYREGDEASLLPMEAEFGYPMWELGLSTYEFLSDGRIACLSERDGLRRLLLINPDGTWTDSGLDWARCASPDLAVAGDTVLLVGATESALPAVVRYDAGNGEAEVLRRSAALSLDPAVVSVPRPMTFPSGDGEAHAFSYPPANPAFIAPGDSKPPLIVMSHGGPTGNRMPGLNLGVQFWTSRGFAVVDVNYGGSTGYGRDYRERLKGRWGEVDVADCVNAARALVASGEADAEKIVIRGGSAGGYTTLCALVFNDDFAAGASYYGVGDLEALTNETHKFESRYLDSLVGPYPEAKNLYFERSPVHHLDRLSCPLILFQGLEDAVVPPAQAEAIVNVLRRKGIPYAYVPFAGEQHGFRRTETVVRALEAELDFYARVLGFSLPEPVEPAPIEGLEAPPT